jgi:hypothetical protein
MDFFLPIEVWRGIIRHIRGHRDLKRGLCDDPLASIRHDSLGLREDRRTIRTRWSIDHLQVTSTTRGGEIYSNAFIHSEWPLKGFMYSSSLSRSSVGGSRGELTKVLSIQIDFPRGKPSVSTGPLTTVCPNPVTFFNLLSLGGSV